MGFQVICLGAVNVDLLYRVPDLTPFLEGWPRLRRGGEVAIGAPEEGRLNDLLSRHARPAGRQGGGQAANTAFALARLGLNAALVGRIGTDADGDFLRDGLKGVNLDYLATVGESGRAYILLDPQGERTILVAPNTNDDLMAADLPWPELAGARFLHLTSFVGPGPLALQMELVKRLQGGPRLTLDPGELYARLGWQGLEDLLDQVETLLLTETEWALLGGEMDRHPYWAPAVVLIKRGGRGVRLLTPVRHLDFPAGTAARLVDTLGAGDVLAAGYLAGLLAGLNLPGAVRLAIRLATYSLRGAGRDSYPDREFLERQLAEMKY
jgi:ribokinase